MPTASETELPTLEFTGCVRSVMPKVWHQQFLAGGVLVDQWHVEQIPNNSSFYVCLSGFKFVQNGC